MSMETKHRVSETDSDMTVEEYTYLKKQQRDNIRKSVAKRKVPITLPKFSFMDKRKK